MKKKLLFILTASMLLFTACSKKENEIPGDNLADSSETVAESEPVADIGSAQISQNDINRIHAAAEAVGLGKDEENITAYVAHYNGSSYEVIEKKAESYLHGIIDQEVLDSSGHRVEIYVVSPENIGEYKGLTTTTLKYCIEQIKERTEELRNKNVSDEDTLADINRNTTLAAFFEDVVSGIVIDEVTPEFDPDRTSSYIAENTIVYYEYIDLPYEGTVEPVKNYTRSVTAICRMTDGNYLVIRPVEYTLDDIIWDGPEDKYMPAETILLHYADIKTSAYEDEECGKYLRAVFPCVEREGLDDLEQIIERIVKYVFPSEIKEYIAEN